MFLTQFSDLNLFLMAYAFIIILCVLLNKASHKFGIPVLLLFIGVGMVLGWKETYDIAESQWINDVCTASLIFIMFYGGFGTKWETARPIATPAGVLATLGVFLTAGIVGAFCHFVLHWSWTQSLLLGAVTSSTDAASVFSILRTHKLGLRHNTAPLLEVESGSNDPCSYMATAIMIKIAENLDAAGNMQGNPVGEIFAMFGQQFVVAIIGAAAVYFPARWIVKKNTLPAGFDMIYILAVAIAAYALPATFGGNGYLSAYFVGIALGNTNFEGRKSLVHFFDGYTTLMQIIIFFLLGTMFRPDGFSAAFLPAAAIFLFLTFIGRPLAVTSILTPFRLFSKVRGKKRPFPANQQVLVSFVGLRGAASIVFAIGILTDRRLISHGIDIDLIFDVVFCLVLISIAAQGSLIPWVSRKLKMIDQNTDVMSTFSDFSEQSSMSFITIHLRNNSPWSGRSIKDLNLPSDMLVSLISRSGREIIPHGSTVLRDGDRVIFCCKTYIKAQKVNHVREHEIKSGSSLIGKLVRDIPLKDGSLILMVRRYENREIKRIVPDGNTKLLKGDTIVFFDPEKKEDKGQVTKDKGRGTKDGGRETRDERQGDEGRGTRD